MLAKRLKQARIAKKLTQEQLAKLVNTKKTTISNYENEHSTPSNEMLRDLADVLEVSSDYLLGRTDEPYWFKADFSKAHPPNEPFDSLVLIKDYIEKKGGADQFGFFNIDEWKDLTPEQVEEVLQDFDYMFQRAKKRNEERE